MRRVFLTVLLTAVMILAWAGASPALAPVGTAFKPMELPAADGTRHQLGELVAGKAALLIYWSLSCPDCQREMPHLAKIYQEYAGKPLVLVVVNADGTEMAIAAQGYARKMNLPGPYLIDSGPNDTLPFAAAYDVFTTPSALVLDKTGKLVQAQEINLDLAKLKAALDGVLAQ